MLDHSQRDPLGSPRRYAYRSTAYLSAALASASGAIAAPQFAAPSVLNPSVVSADTFLEDVDRDGLVDVVVVNPFRRRLEWLRGLGGDAFAPARPLFNNASALTPPAFGDVDGDGDRDLILATATDQLQLVLAAPSGLVGFPIDLGVQGTRVRDIQLGDVDGDGDLDIVLLEVPNSQVDRVSISLNMGTGGFAAPTTAIQLSSGYFEALAVGDIDADGMDDLAYLRRASLIGGSQLLTVALAGGLGAFQTPTVVESYSGGAGGFLLADLTGDGRLDLALRDGFPVAGVLVHQGLAGGQFSAAQSFNVPGAAPRDIGAADMDLDGDVDLVITTPNNQGQPTLQFFPAQAGGAFGALLPAGFAQLQNEVNFSDLNGDGWPDAVGQFRFGDSALGWSPHGGPAAVPLLGSALQLSDYFAGGRAATVGDLDGDGLEDVISMDRSVAGSDLVVVSHAVVGPYGIRSLPSPLANSAARLLETADLDADGQDDLIITSAAGDLVVARSLGSTGLGAPVQLGDAEPSVRVRPEDIDGDGDLDLVAVRASGIELAWYPNLGAFSFGPPQRLATATSPISTIRAADLDGDGLRDLAITQTGTTGSGGTFWLRRTGPGAFGAPTQLSMAPDEASGLSIGDFNGDGVVDLAWASHSIDALFLANGLGAGAFGTPVLVSTATDKNTQLESSDLDLDGDLDLVIRGMAGSIRVLRNDGASSFAAQPFLDDLATGMNLVDLDRDGDVDLISSEFPRQRLRFFENQAIGAVGTPVCGPAVPNSTGASARAAAIGSVFASANELTLRATELPAGTFAFFLASQTVSLTFPVTGSAGRLCLGSGIGRIIGPGQIQWSGASGTISVPVDVQRLPTPNGLVAAAAGQTWSFQAWFRDTLPNGAGTSNFTNAVSVSFQ